MSNVISTAANEYAKRPADERFASIEALVANAEHDRVYSVERNYNLKDLKVQPGDKGLELVSPKGSADFTHWSFGQLARTLKAPAGYLRSLPADIAADALNFGLKSSATGETCNLLVKANGGRPVVRAATSETYGRLWDAPLYSGVLDSFGSDSAWGLPPSWSGDPMGAYRGDRDSFLTICNGGSIVTDPSLSNRKGGELYRGLMIRNSEVGASSVIIEAILYEFVCGNNNYWGAVIDKKFRRRHVGTKVLRDTIREIATMAKEWAQRSPAADEAIIRQLMTHELAATRDGVIDELKAIGFTKQDAESAYDTCERSFEASPRSFWGINQGVTKLSQDTLYQDERFELDKLAGLVLSRGAKLVRV